MRRLMRAAHLARRAWWWAARPVTLGVKVVLVDPDGRVVLVRHTYQRGWYLPGGGVRRRESFDRAARREIREELDIDVDGSLELVGIYFSTRSFKRDHVVVYVARRWSGTPRAASREIAEVRLVTPDDLPADATPATIRRIAEVFAGARVTGVW